MTRQIKSKAIEAMVKTHSAVNQGLLRSRFKKLTIHKMPSNSKTAKMSAAKKEHYEKFGVQNLGKLSQSRMKF